MITIIITTIIIIVIAIVIFINYSSSPFLWLSFFPEWTVEYFSIVTDTNFRGRGCRGRGQQWRKVLGELRLRLSQLEQQSQMPRLKINLHPMMVLAVRGTTMGV